MVNLDHENHIAYKLNYGNSNYRNHTMLSFHLIPKMFKMNHTSEFCFMFAFIYCSKIKASSKKFYFYIDFFGELFSVGLIKV